MTKRRKYTQDEIDFLIDNYSNMGWDEIINGLEKVGGNKRSKSSILMKASNMGLMRKNSSFSDFTPEEDKMIIELYNNSSQLNLSDNIEKLIQDKMPYRTKGSVRNRANRLGLLVRYPWTKDEDDFLIEHYYDMTVKEIAEHLEHHNRNSVYNRIIKLGLHGAPTFAYTDEDIQFIRDNYLTMSDEEIGKVLHRERKSIKECRRKHKIYRRDPDETTHYLDMIRFIQAHNSEWKKKSMANCGYKCVLSGGEFHDIHHLYAKNLILNAALDRLEIPYDFDINNCDNETKEKILMEFFKEQDKHPLGVCLHKNLHHKFHAMYGFGYNTPEQFQEFAEKVTQNNFCETLIQ